MLTINMILLVGVISFLACGLGIMFLIKYLEKKQILDIPNNRSSHVKPTPRGGGIVIVIISILSFLSLKLFKFEESWVTPPHSYEIWVVLGCFFVLGLVSLYDDIKGLSFKIRLAVHIVAAITAIAVLPYETKVFPDFIPLLAEKSFFVLLLVWFMNLYNFMDGIDGITSIETIIIGAGLFFLFLLKFIPITLGVYGLLLAFILLAFLFYNWSPARIFMGDVGSIPLGFILGWLLLKITYEGHWYAALILPLYYLVDATSTLIIRIAKGKKPWEAHKDHFYQKLVQRGLSHSKVSLIILKINTILLFLGIASGFSEKAISIVFMALVYVIYMMNKTLNLGGKEKSYKELKDEMIEDFKSEIIEAKNNINIIIDKTNKNDK